MSAEWRPSRYAFSEMGMNRVARQPHFEQKQVHTVQQLLGAVGKSLVFHKASVDAESGVFTDQQIAGTVVGTYENGDIEIELQGSDGPVKEPRTPSDLCLAPFPDGTWTASQYVSFGILKQNSA